MSAANGAVATALKHSVWMKLLTRMGTVAAPATTAWATLATVGSLVQALKETKNAGLERKLVERTTRGSK